MGAYADFEDELLVAAYLVSEETGEDFLKLRDVIAPFRIEYREPWLRRALQSLIESGYSGDARHLGGDYLDQSIWLTPSGFKRGEELASHVKLESAPAIATPRKEKENVAPAADRIVSFDHNAPEFLQIRNGIAEAREAVRQANDISENERDQVLRGLDSAQTLWDALQLKAIQIKVGVLMAVQDAAAALQSTAKAVAISLLADTIKAFVKTHTGIDLDHL